MPLMPLPFALPCRNFKYFSRAFDYLFGFRRAFNFQLAFASALPLAVRLFIYLLR
jgi:hypothetical protein